MTASELVWWSILGVGVIASPFVFYAGWKLADVLMEIWQ
jgi:hypothetical protein